MAEGMERRPTTQDISWFLDLHRNGQLELEPPYQRRSVWSRRDRQYFLDTIFRGYPSPAVFLYKRIREPGTAGSGAHSGAGTWVYDVVDGKQRLETILKFLANNVTIAPDFGDASLDGKKWEALTDTWQRRFWDYVIPVEFIKIVEGTIVNEVFERLNRNSRKLERQELRHARNDGWFIKLAESEAENDSFWVTYKVSTRARARRMRDVQLISELLMVVLKNEVTGFDQDALDQVCADYDVPEDTVPDFDKDAFAERFAEVKQYIRDLDAHNQCVTTYATTSTHMYSLWAWVALAGQKPQPTQAAERYATFMQLATNPALLEEQHVAAPQEAEPRKYALNSIGASTEPAQRIARHQALIGALPAGP